MAESNNTSGVQSRHPAYNDMINDWETCRDCKKGERAVKSRTVRYLPATSGMYEDGYGSADALARGNTDYKAYITRATFASYLERACDNYLGMLWHKEAQIDLPAKMEPLRDSCTRQHSSMLQLLREMHDELLTSGRLGLLADMPEGLTTEALPYVTMYRAEKIINWDEGEDYQVSADSLNLVVLDESGVRRNTTFSYEYVNEFRVLLLGSPDINEESNETAVYSAAIVLNTQGFSSELLFTPNYHGNLLHEIPFVFVNSKNLDACPEEPPQLALARKDLTIYRGEADYRQALSQQAQPTLVVAGETVDPNGKGIRLGVGAVINISNPAGHAEFIGPDPVGIPEMRAAIENDRREAELLSGQLTDTRSNDKESGSAQQIRMDGATVSLDTIAIEAALGLQTILRKIAVWIGADPEQVVVTANKEFSPKQLTPADLLALQNAKNMGLPITDESIHDQVRQSGYTDKDYETETAQIGTEEPRLPLITAQAGLDQEGAANDQQLGEKTAKTQHGLGQKAADAQSKRDASAAKLNAKLNPKPKAPRGK